MINFGTFTICQIAASLLLCFLVSCGSKNSRPPLDEYSGGVHREVVVSDLDVNDPKSPGGPQGYAALTVSEAEIAVRPTVECVQVSLLTVAPTTTLIVNCIAYGAAGNIALPDEGKFEWAFEPGPNRITPTLSVMDDNGSSATFTFKAPANANLELFKESEFALLHAADVGTYKLVYGASKYKFEVKKHGAKLSGQKCLNTIGNLINVRQLERWSIVTNSTMMRYFSGPAPEADSYVPPNVIIGAQGRATATYEGGNFILLLGGDLKHRASAGRFLVMDSASLSTIATAKAVFAGPSAIINAPEAPIFRFRSELGLCALERI